LRHVPNSPIEPQVGSQRASTGTAHWTRSLVRILPVLPFALCVLTSSPALAQNDPLDEGAAPEEPLPAPDGQPPVVHAKSAILIDARTGTVLFEKDARTHRPPASTTKIMTATLLLEHRGLDAPVVASVNAAHCPYANLHLRPGERISMHDLLYAILLRSANDGCVAAAEAVAGTVPDFVTMMNYKAREIGCTDTHFVTPNGLYDPQHYTTAADLAKMAMYATQYDLFNEIVATREKVISRTIARTDSLMRNHNRLLSRYPGCDGIKTGYVHQSGKCLVASATHDEAGHPWRLISVVLNSPDTYHDSAVLLNYGFTRYKQVFVAARGERVGSASVKWGIPNAVPVLAASDVAVIVPRAGTHRVERSVALRSQEAPLRAGAALGQVAVTVDGKPAASICLAKGRPSGSADLLTGEKVSRNWITANARFASAPLVVTLLLGFAPRYARTLAKGPRRRRRRVPPRRRSSDIEWARSGRRSPGHGAWDES
jgi:D-alanyl-D-alanine carboxypeptidase (penicillin-binding protein 5/6)